MANAFVRSCFRQHSCFAFHQKLALNGYYFLKRRARSSKKFLVYIKTANEVYSKQYLLTPTHHTPKTPPRLQSLPRDSVWRKNRCVNTKTCLSQSTSLFFFFLLKARNGLTLLELPLMTMCHHRTHSVHHFHAAKHAETDAGDRPVKFRLKTLK